jgi:hypothetical protein
MSLTTQAFTYAHNNADNLTTFIEDRVSKLIKSDDNDYDKDTTFVVFTTFENGVFSPHVMAESDFHHSTLVDMYALELTVITAITGRSLTSNHKVNQTSFVSEFGQSLRKAQDLDANANAVLQTNDKTVIAITNYDKQLPLKSFLLKTGQDIHKVRAGLDKLIHISSNRPSIVKDMADWYYDKLMEKSLNNFLLDTNYGLDVLNDITERVTYVIQ